MPPYICLVPLNKEEMPSPTDVIVAAIAGWSPTWLVKPAQEEEAGHGW